MTGTMILQNDVASLMGAGVDLLQDALPASGLDASLVIDVATTGGASMIGIGMGGATSQALDAFAQTGSSSDDAALLCGSAGIDTLGALPAEHRYATGGNNNVGVPALGDLGCNTAVEAMAHQPAMGESRDFSVSYILDRVAAFSFAAPVSVAFRTGYAR